MKKAILLIFLIIIVMACNDDTTQQNGCNNDADSPIIDIQGDNTIGPAGTVINFTTTATDDYEVKKAYVDGVITYESGGTMLETYNIGIIYMDSTTLAPTVNGSFSYTVPTTIGNDSLGGPNDYIEFVAHVEDCYGAMSNNYNFNITE